MSFEIMWLGHASVMIRTGEKVIYIDPWKVDATLPQADIILLTHDHYDHYSQGDIAVLAGDTTRIVAPMPAEVVTDRINAGDSLVIDDVLIEVLPAYNIDKNFHPRANNWVGYVVHISGRRVYHTGDTDRIPEMMGLRVDVALMPVGGTYTMTADEANQALMDMQAQHVIPIHYGDIVGSSDDAQRLSDISTNTVHILEPGESFILE
jgi:L-ascorbate metabolism protein UlaG (beta-lactamase superfamily)